MLVEQVATEENKKKKRKPFLDCKDEGTIQTLLSQIR